MTPYRWAALDVVRAHIAAHHGHDLPADARLGDIVLRDHQRDAAARLRQGIDRFGGALLADEVGLGKTYTALAAMRREKTLLIVAPAALVAMWRDALDRSRVRAEIISFETLSRRAPAREATWDAVIIDEAHHARNPTTRRYAHLASLTRASRVLLLSATPVHNTTRDLGAVLALFLGSRAEHLTAAEIAACVVRRTRADVRGLNLPGRASPVWCDVEGSPNVLQALLDVPPPCQPRDGGDAGALVTLSLMRAWASSEAALRAALRRRVSRAESLAHALEAGRHLSRAELRAWVVGDDATQLAFPELLSDAMSDDATMLLQSARAHAVGARRALGVLSSTDGAMDEQRCRILRDIRSRHPGERIVVFSQYADTVREVFARLRSDGGVASVTANGALVAGGPLTRSQVLGRFAPVASSGRVPSRAEAIEMLIATDLLSEGLNLQDAAVVVHLDLPWTTARLTQRLGRIWRIGSQHARVHEYAIAPPAAADQLLRIVQVLTRKAGAAWSAIGEPFLPLLESRAQSSAARTPLDRVQAAEALHTLIRSWSDSTVERGPSMAASNGESRADTTIVVAGARAAMDGWIAAVEMGGQRRLVAARTAGQATTDPECVLEVARAAGGPECPTAPARVERVIRELDAYLNTARAAADAGVAGVGSRTRAIASSRIAALAAAVPPHRRPAVSQLAVAARRSVAASRSAGAERLLAAIVAPGVGNEGADAAEAWLERVIEVTESLAPNADSEPNGFRVSALIVLVQDQRA
ncbi:MAG TPA: DEAD/DEAH box helicase [Gemmatimonadaceae bacterium]|nr:DEAD/DEAH box helicase [Gemmatimonadaceae bacterium]